MDAKVFGGEEVKILTSGGEIDPNTYNVQFVKRDLVGLLNRETGITIKVNDKRIYKVVKENQNENNVAVVETPTITVEPDQNSEIKTSPKKEKPKTPEKLDFDQMINDGFEVWTKGGLSLGNDPKISQIVVAAHCIIDPDDVEDRGYEIFNSYNGTRGAKGKVGKRYHFTEKMTIERKRKTLAKKGYVKHEI